MRAVLCSNCLLQSLPQPGALVPSTTEVPPPRNSLLLRVVPLVGPAHEFLIDY
jgi:hypothetical protein